MFEAYCSTLTPVHIQGKFESFINPIKYSGRIYIIQDKKLYEVLSRIGLLQEFIQNIREKDYNFTSKWLSSKQLLNEGLLENVSHYWIEDADIQKLTNYKPFFKSNNMPVILNDFFRNIFKRVLLYSYIHERRDIFNRFVEKELDSIELELKYINNISTYCIVQNGYRLNIFKRLIRDFLSVIDKEFIQTLQAVDNLTFSIDTQLNNENLSVYKIGSINNYTNSGIQISNPAQCECLKENTLIKMTINFINSNFDRYSGLEYLDYLFDQANILAKNKINFDRNYITNLINSSDTSGIICTIENIKSCINYMNGENEPDYNYKNVALLDYPKFESLKIKNHIVNYFDSISSSNLLMCCSSELTQIISVLNLNKSNLIRLNQIIFEKNNKSEFDIVKLAFKKANIPYSSVGYVNFSF